MADIQYGGSAGDWRDAIRRAQEQGRANDEMRQKEEQRQSVEERGQTVDRRSVAERQSMGEATAGLSSRLTANAEALRAENAALETSIGLMARAVALRREMAGVPIVSGSERAAAGRAAAGGTAAPIVADPNAAARAAAAERRVAEAEIAAAAARSQAASAARSAGATPEQLTPLVSQREVANQQLQTARSELRAAQANVELQNQRAAEQAREVENMRQINAVDQQLRAQRDAQLAAGASAVVSQRGSLALPPARYIEAGPTGSTGPGGIGYTPRPRPIGPRGTPLFGVTSGGPAERVSLAGYGEQEASHIAGLRGEATANAQALTQMGRAQAEVNQQMAQANAIFADNSTLLSRHGALTTEFIQALARGQVTLAEFGSQMTSVIGKFGGWAIAGAAVYGVYDALKHVYDGARDTQAAVQQLGRFLPGLGGPAGGGTGQVGAAQATVRNISTQFNVPISEVTDAMQVMARTFHTVSDAGDATRAALAAYRLDQVPLGQSEQYLVGIANTMGYTHGSQVVDVVNQLNQLQASYGVRVAQSLPGLARAVPSAVASGVQLPELEALVGLGVRSGVSGNQIGTALVRSMTNFAFRPGSATIFGQYGITPQIGQYGGLIRQVMGFIDERSHTGTLTGTELRNLAVALGGPQLGGRSILPILEQEALHPGFYGQATGRAQQPRSYQEDLNQVLGSVSERFRSIGISLSAFGSELGNVTLLPIVGLLDVVQHTVGIFELLLAPVSEVTHVLASLPAPMRDLLAVLIAIRAARFIGNTQLGGAASTLIGRLPGLDFLRSQPRESVLGARATLQRALPEDQREAELSSRRYRSAVAERQSAIYAQQQLKQTTPLAVRTGPLDDPATQQYVTAATAARQRIASATDKAALAEQAYVDASLQAARTQGLINTMKDRQLTFAQRAALLEEEGWYTLSPQNDLAKQTTQAYVERARSLGGGPAGSVGTAAAAATGADVAAVTAAALRQAARSPAEIDDLVQTVGRSQAPPGFRPPPRPAGAAGPTAGERLAGLAGGYGLFSDAELSAMRERVARPVLGAAGRFSLSDLSGRLGGALTGPGGPIAGIIGAQLIGGALPTGPAQNVTNQLGTGFTGLLIAQMLGRGPVGMGLGFLGGSLLGAAQQGSGSAIGSGIGTVVGGAVGTALDAFTFGTGTFIGAGLGSLAGRLIGGLVGGGGPPPGVTAADHANQATRRAMQTVAAANRQLDPRGGFLLQFDKALTLGGSAGSNAQTQASAQLQQLQAEMLIFGPGSTIGRQAQSLSASAILSTLQSARSNPAAAQQLLQGADQARQTAITNQLKYGLQTGAPGSEFAVAGQAAAQFTSEMAPYQQAVSKAAQGVNDAQAQVNAALKTHNTRLIAQQRQALSDAQSQLSAVQGVAKQEEETRQLNIQQAYQQAYQYTSQYTQAQGALAQARAGGNVTAQARAQAVTARQQIDSALQLQPYDPHTAAIDLANAQAQLLQAQARIATQGLAELQARGGVTEARVFTGDPIQQARVNLENLRQQYDYIRQNSHAFDPSQIRQALAGVIAADQQLAQTVSDYETSMIGLQTQIAQAQAYGNRIQQAGIGIQGASRQLAVARTPTQRAQAMLNIAQAQSQQFDALTQTIQAQNQLAQAQASGNPTEQAALAVRGAQLLLANAHGIDNVRAAETALAQAQYQYEQALEQRFIDLGNLAASTTLNPVQQLRDQVSGIARALSIATRPQDRVQLQTQLNNTTHQMEASLIDQREQTTNFQFQMMEISTQQAIQQLQGLLHLQGLTRAKRQEILQQIRQYELGLISPIGAAGQFDLAPGNIRLPSFYDVAHALRGGRPAANATMTAVNAPMQVNVYVRRGEDVPKVADALDRALGGHVRQRLRAAGVSR